MNINWMCFAGLFMVIFSVYALIKHDRKNNTGAVWLANFKIDLSLISIGVIGLVFIFRAIFY